MYHIHSKGMIIAHKKLIIFQHFLNPFASPFFSPMRHPPRIYFSTQQKPLFLKLPNSIFLLFPTPIINTNISTFPMTFMNILNPIHIIFCEMNIKVMPYLTNLLHVLFISAIESILILYLEHDYAACWVWFCALVFSDYGKEGLEVCFCLL